MVVDGPAIRATPADVDAQWLASVLTDSGAATPGSAIGSFTAVNIGAGKVGQNVRFSLEWSAGSGPATVVGKFASDDDRSRAAGVMTGTYLREARFYQQLAHRVAIRLPDCHLATIDLPTGEFTLLFSDLAPAEVGDQIAGCTVDEAALALTELPGLHAHELGSAALRDLDWVMAKDGTSADALANIYRALLPTFLDRYNGRVRDDVIDTAERFGPVVERWLQRSDEPLGLVHGDYRLDNLMFDDDHVWVVDWQTIGLAPPVSDVSYFLGAGLDPDVRLAHERELLNEYLGRLHALSPTAAAGISADQAWRDHRLQSFAGLHMTVVASVLVGEDERSDAMFRTMAERHSRHILDLDAFSLLG